MNVDLMRVQPHCYRLQKVEPRHQEDKGTVVKGILAPCAPLKPFE